MKAMTSYQFTYLTLATVTLFALALSFSSHAQTPANSKQGMSGQSKQTAQGGGQGERPRREPPPQAYEKCKAKKEGEVVQIITPHGEKITAHCTASAKGLFARPERPPEGHEGRGEDKKEGGQRKK